jgi:heparin/heparan-sulfate lyase
MLIRMPEETMPKYWGEVGFPAPGETLVPVPNDGGQNDLLGSEIVGFDENPYYVYIASDATKSYNPDKAGLVLRQLVFLPPDHFIIFDRVVSMKPEYKKTWMLHTATEPVISGDSFSADQDQGRLFCKTLFPENAKLNKVGGPGKQFWSGGQNWPIPDSNPDVNFNKSNTRELLGQWRMEISPDGERAEDFFLHLIQVGDRSLTSIAETRSIKTLDQLGLQFQYGTMDYEVKFDIKNSAGGRISIKQNGNHLLQENFSKEIKSQKGLF